AQAATAQEGGGGGGGGGGGSPANTMEMIQQELMLVEQQIAQVQQKINGVGIPQLPQSGAGQSTDAASLVNSRFAASGGGGGGGNSYPPPVVTADGHVDGYM
ncbi:MAG: hypothetical protein LIQ30_01420, partial [Planctomycetes bacterium]|nr:hypothetical protein [Planctomycetota bacterium]